MEVAGGRFQVSRLGPSRTQTILHTSGEICMHPYTAVEFVLIYDSTGFHPTRQKSSPPRKEFVRDLPNTPNWRTQLVWLETSFQNWVPLYHVPINRTTWINWGSWNVPSATQIIIQSGDTYWFIWTMYLLTFYYHSIYSMYSLCSQNIFCMIDLFEECCYRLCCISIRFIVHFMFINHIWCVY